MTAWQDQQPLSRRQARRNERGAAAGETTVGLATPEQPASPQTDSDAAVASGRRAQQAYPQTVPPAGYPAVTPEPLTYSTQGRPQAANYDGAPFRGSSSPAEPTGRQDDQAPAYRVRDYSPEGRRAAPLTPAPAWTPPATDPSGVLDYHTQAEPAPQVAPVPVVAPAPAPAERTISRRELRALWQQQSQQQAEAVKSSEALVSPEAPVSPEAVVEPQAPTESPRLRERNRQQQSTPFNDALAEFDALTNGLRAADTSQPQTFPTAAVPTDPPALVEPRSPRQTPSDAVTPSGLEGLLGGLLGTAEPAPSEVRPAEPAVSEPVHSAPVAAAASAVSATQDRAGQGGTEQDSTDQDSTAQAACEQPPPAAPRVDARFVPPVGHWSTQAQIDDDEQFPETTLTRNITATTGSTTNALVLPEMPTVDDILSPLGSTGEILVTGSINLSRSLSTSGAHPGRLDHADMDAMLDSAAREDSSDPDSAPIRAIRAVSTQTGPNVIIQTKKHKSRNLLPVVLAVCAAVMVAGVVALVIVGVFTKSF